MARQLKRWESPRKEGRNSKGKGGSARQRQLKKQFKALKQKLQNNSNTEGSRHTISSLSAFKAAA